MGFGIVSTVWYVLVYILYVYLFSGRRNIECKYQERNFDFGFASLNHVYFDRHLYFYYREIKFWTKQSNTSEICNQLTIENGFYSNSFMKLNQDCALLSLSITNRHFKSKWKADYEGEDIVSERLCFTGKYINWIYLLTYFTTRRVFYKKQELLTPRQHLNSTPFLVGFRVAQLFKFFVLSFYVSLRSAFRVVMSIGITISA